MADNEELLSRMRHELDRDRPFDRALAEEAIEALSRDTESGWREVLRMAELYADFIRHHVKAADIEMHPYLPELESIIERAKLASPAEPAAIASSPAPEPKQGDGWIEWKGGECPVRPEDIIDFRRRDGSEYRGIIGADELNWGRYTTPDGSGPANLSTDIIAYRPTSPESRE